MITHSGINFKAKWWQPWQPDAVFHDNHHQYFHVNFGFNCWLWDKVRGQYFYTNFHIDLSGEYVEKVEIVKIN